MRVIFLGGKQAGIICLLTAIAWGCKVEAVVTQSEMLRRVAVNLGIPVFGSYKDVPGNSVDLMISAHSREILPVEFLSQATHGGINVHPCLYKYKGVRPVPRMIADGVTKASVGIHRMTDQVDEGEVIIENYQEIIAGTAGEVYNQLYPLYSTTLMEALDKL